MSVTTTILEKPEPPVETFETRAKKRSVSRIAPAHFVLEGVSWKTYESLLADYQEKRAPRFTYDKGKLEIMSPLPRHEDTNWAIARIIEIAAEEWGIEFLNLGSTTFRREDLGRGFEPDACYYIQNYTVASALEEFDPLTDPAPDLVIEVEETNPLLSKLQLLADFGIPEEWRVLGSEKNTTFLRLVDGQYQETETSLALPRMASASVSRLLQQDRKTSRLAWLRTVREWARGTMTV